MAISQNYAAQLVAAGDWTVVTSLTALTYLDFSGMGLWGTIPSTLTRLAALSYLDFSNNMLTGSIPPSFKCVDLDSH